MFGQLNPGSTPRSVDSLERDAGVALMQSSIFADIQAWLLTNPWVTRCAHDDWDGSTTSSDSWSTTTLSDTWNTLTTDPIKVEGC